MPENPKPKNYFARFEKQLERLIEGSSARFFGHSVDAADLAREIVRAMDMGLSEDKAGSLHAPDRYGLMMNPRTLDAICSHAPDFKTELAQILHHSALDRGFLIAYEPQITFTTDLELPDWKVEAKAWHSLISTESTDEIPLREKPFPVMLPKKAYLIVDGTKHFALNQPVINIGRSRDNQLILDAPQISRGHAQLQARHGHYLLFDLGSKAGTFVNDLAIRQHILQSGDVISIGEIKLIYGEDHINDKDTTSTYIRPTKAQTEKDQMESSSPDMEGRSQ
jgi:hypothetical protein